jgi:adenosylhomocysteine nucleosidase
MWQPLLRSWLMGKAREQMAAAAKASVDETRPDRSPGDASAPPQEPKATCHVAVICALSIEAGGLIDRLAGVVRIEGAGFVAREGGFEGRRIVVVESGAGSPSAARATVATILGHRPRWVISAGFAGGLEEAVQQGDLVMASEVVDPEGHVFTIDIKPASEDARSSHMHVGRVLTMDRVIDTAQEKRALGTEHRALAVDMESFGVATICQREKTRFLAVRVITDAVDHTLPPDIDRLVKRTSTAGRLGAAAGAILRRPASIKDMWQLKEDAIVASERLANFLTGVIRQLP